MNDVSSELSTVHKSIDETREKAEELRDFRPMSVVRKRLDGSICHLVRRSASAKATLCYMGIQLPPQEKGGTAGPFPLFGPCLQWPNGRPS